jgi:hypothetical protein
MSSNPPTTAAQVQALRKIQGFVTAAINSIGHMTSKEEALNAIDRDFDAVVAALQSPGTPAEPIGRYRPECDYLCSRCGQMHPLKMDCPMSAPSAAEPSGPVETPPRLVAEPVGRTGIGVRIRQDAGLRDTALPQAEPRSLADQLHDDLLQSQAEPSADGPPADLVALVREWQAAKATIRRIFDAWDSGDDGPSDAGVLGPVVQRRKDAEAALISYPLPAEQAPR